MEKEWLWKSIGEETVKNLKAHGFDAHYCSDVASCRSLCLELARVFSTFGVGGSNTIRSMGLVGDLLGQGKTVYDHWVPTGSKEEELQIRLMQGRSECFLTSANAISQTGEIINVDGIGNRVSAMCFGPKKVLIVAGMNKVRPDLESALRRVKEVAGPLRAKSLKMKTPCAETGICNDCNSPQRICRITTILHRRPSLTDVSVLLVGEELGF